MTAEKHHFAIERAAPIMVLPNVWNAIQLIYEEVLAFKSTYTRGWNHWFPMYAPYFSREIWYRWLKQPFDQTNLKSESACTSILFSVMVLAVEQQKCMPEIIIPTTMKNKLQVIVRLPIITSFVIFQVRVLYTLLWCMKIWSLSNSL